MKIISKGLVLAGIISLVAGAFIWAQTRNTSDEIPVYAELNEFTLTDQDKNPFGLENFKGKVTVVNFIFTSCPMVCPRLTRQMSMMEKESQTMGDGLRFLSISVDPETDNPSVLKAYGKEYGADFSRWKFVTGPLEEVRRVVIESFKTAMDSDESGEVSLFSVTHGENFVLVDSQARVRGFFQVKTPEDREKVLNGARDLLGRDLAYQPQKLGEGS